MRMAFRCAHQEEVSYNAQVPFFSKDVGILKDLAEAWPSAVEWFAQGDTAG